MKLKPMSVSKVNHYIHKQLHMDPILNNALVVGEISNYKAHTSGHIYFSIKDENSRINCVMFYRDACGLDFQPSLGDRVEIRGKISVYEREGKYQINVKQMLPVGQGELHQAFVAMKKSLMAQGYFDKKASPCLYPRKIGLITSPTGAAVRDVLTVLKKRYPMVQVILYPVLVQGDRACIEIATAVDYFNENPSVDTLIICRGGGSIEALWPFNELMVAEAIFNSTIPVITGIGHETDFTIADFVSDQRGATPSEAASMACGTLQDQKDQMAYAKDRMVVAMKGQIKDKQLLFLRSKHEKMTHGLFETMQGHYTYIDNLSTTMHNEVGHYMTKLANTIQGVGDKLETLSPLKTLNRGYSLVMKDKEVVRHINQVEIGDSIDIILENGIINVETVSKKVGHDHE